MLSSTLHRVILVLAACHLAAGYRIWFPDSDASDFYQEGFYQPQRVPEQQSNSYQPQRVPEQQSNSYVVRDERQVEASRPSRPQQVFPVPRETTNSRAIPSTATTPRPMKKAQNKPVVVKPLRPVAVPTTTQPPFKPASQPPAKKTHPIDDFTDDEREFDDYWLEDNLKAEQEVKKSPSACVWAIISCCKPASAATTGVNTKQQVRYSCFEAMNCHGAFWDVNPCSRPMMKAALQATAEFYNVKPKTD